MSDPKVTLAGLSHDHSLADFDCGDGELSEFLCVDALAYQASFFANTTLMLEGGRVVGFFSQFPALKIARLGQPCRTKGTASGLAP